MLYRNEPSIIVGKHQNAIAEINLEFVRQRGVSVVRRLSGGGTVYHDLGNINYSFIANGSEGNLVDFKKFTQPIIEVLQKLGVDAHIGGKNDIRVGDRKISGNAEHVYKNRVIHHGTLLFSSDLDELNNAIKVDPNVYTDKAVKSIRSHVANITEYLNDNLTPEEFSITILDHIKKLFSNALEYSLSKEETRSINELVKTKYSTWEWNFGYSPSYTLSKQVRVDGKQLNIIIRVEKGIINQVEINGDFLNNDRIRVLELMLTGCQHDVNEVKNKLSKVDLNDFIPGITLAILLEGLF